MTALLELVMLATATCLALGVASALQWMLLRSAVQLMRPAGVRPVQPRAQLVRATVQVARADASRR